MPGMSGAALATAARELIPDLPVIIASGNMRAIDAAVDGWENTLVIAKPYEPEALEGALETLFAE